MTSRRHTAQLLITFAYALGASIGGFLGSIAGVFIAGGTDEVRALLSSATRSTDSRWFQAAGLIVGAGLGCYLGRRVGFALLRRSGISEAEVRRR